MYEKIFYLVYIPRIKQFDIMHFHNVKDTKTFEKIETNFNEVECMLHEKLKEFMVEDLKEERKLEEFWVKKEEEKAEEKDLKKEMEE